MPQTETPDRSDRPFRRIVFYISGFDPRGAAFLHKTCVEETQRWSRVSGHPVETGKRRAMGPTGKAWPITAELPAGRVETDFQFLRWDDIVRQHWERRRWLVAIRIVILAISFISSGTNARTWRDSYPMAITITATTLPFFLAVAGALLLGGSVALLWPGTGWVAKSFGILFLVLIGLLAWLGSFYLIRYKPDWTGRIGLFGWAVGDGKVPGIHERMDAMADHIVATIEKEKPDEALIVGHSIGTTLATVVGSRVLKRKPELGAAGSPLALATLGQVHSLVGLMPQSDWFREELAHYAGFPDFTWVDVTAPPDGACYVMVDPLEFMTGPRPANLPRLINAQFYKTFSHQRVEEGRADRMLMHFFYIQSPDHPQLDTDLYDFIAMIAGPKTLGERFGRRASATRPFYRKEAA